MPRMKALLNGTFGSDSRRAQVAAGVKIDINNPSPGFNNGHGGIFAHKIDQTLATAWNHQIDVLVCGEDRQKGFPFARSEVKRLLQLVISQDAFNQFHDGQVRKMGITATFKTAALPDLRQSADTSKVRLGREFRRYRHRPSGLEW
jgi:hypothetical protein